MPTEDTINRLIEKVARLTEKLEHNETHALRCEAKFSALHWTCGVLAVVNIILLWAVFSPEQIAIVLKTWRG